MKYFFAFLVLACFLGACVSRFPGEQEAGKKAAAESSPGPGKKPVPVQRVPGDGLDSPRFGELPGEARKYLAALSEAFRKKDIEFIISQGEIQYENELRFRHEEEVYLALLYRIGPYSEENPDKSLTPPRLEYADVEEIEYTDWEENGPVLEISGYLYLKNGVPVPCGITLVWRLPEPKILGAYP